MLAVLSVVFAALSYWDLQDGDFYERGIMMPILMGVMAVFLLLFPGGKTTFVAIAGEGDGFSRWLGEIPAWHKKAWLGGFLLSFYLGEWASHYLQGQDFFSLGNQLTALFVAVAMGVVFPWYWRRRYGR